MNPLDPISAPLISTGIPGQFAIEESESAPLLIFRVGETLWALPALAVSEMHALPLLSPLPESAPFMLGMFNLRGAIVPVLDLSARLSHPSPPLRLDDKLIVLDWNGAPLALRADEVRAVSHISGAQIGAPPMRGRKSDGAARFVAGVVQIDEEIVLLLHLSHLLDFDHDFDHDFDRDFDRDLRDFEPVSKTVSPAPAVSPAPRFDLVWTESERAVLQNRADRLRQVASPGEEDGNSERESAEDEGRAPVAVFALGGEEFAVSLGAVREFASVLAVANVPCCPPHILGQINLRATS